MSRPESKESMEDDASAATHSGMVSSGNPEAVATGMEWDAQQLAQQGGAVGALSAERGGDYELSAQINEGHDYAVRHTGSREMGERSSKTHERMGVSQSCITKISHRERNLLCAARRSLCSGSRCRLQRLEHHRYSGREGPRRCVHATADQRFRGVCGQ